MEAEKINKCIIQFKNVSFGYTKDQTILNDLSFSINENDYVCIVGKNGSGKSTLAHLLIGLIKPRVGEIYYNDVLLEKKNILDYKHDVAAVLENPDSMFVSETVEDEIAFSLENINKERREMSKIITNISTSLDLKDLLNKDPNSLSGGQKQKVAIACCLAINPKIIILDEATSMLDPHDKIEIRNLIKTLHTKFNKTIISITHDIEEAMDANSIMVMDEGKIIKHLPSLELFEKVNVSKYGLNEPFAVSLSKKLGINVTNDLDILAKEVIKNVK